MPPWGFASTTVMAIVVVSGFAVVVVAVGFVALDVVLYVRGGRSVGRLLLSLRTVDDLTGRPPAVLRVDRRGRFSIRRQAVTVDLRRGRDPMTSSPPLVQRPALPAAASAPLPPHPTDPLDAAGRPDENTFGRTGQGRPTTTAPSIVLELDSGERLDLEQIYFREPRVSDPTRAA